MKLNFLPNRQFYTNQDVAEDYMISNYHTIERELYDTKDKLRKLEETKYKEIADSVQFDIKEFNKMKFNIANYGCFFQEVFELMKDRGFTKEEFEEVGKKHGLNLSYLNI